MKNKRVTLKDIANELGLHHTTVSMALRNSPMIKDETRKKIQAMAIKMKYRPNLLAQGFRRRSSHTIGVLVPQIHHHFFSNFISEITEYAIEAGYTIMVMQSNEKFETERINIESLVQNRVAGVIASVSLETADCRHFMVFKEERIPLVLFDRIPDDYWGTSVAVNNYQLAYDAVKLLVEMGKKRIAFIGFASHLNVFTERIRGFKDALKRYGQFFHEYLILETGIDAMSGARAAKQLIENKIKPDAILTVSDMAAMGAIKYLKRSGYRIPEDIGLMGFDNHPMGLAVEPELTTCLQPVNQLAKITFNTLLDRMENEIEINKRILIMGNIIKRNSC